jgi:hypothetical protein
MVTKGSQIEASFCRCQYVEQKILKRLPWTALIPGFRDMIDTVTDLYHQEGMPSEEEGNPQGAYDLAVIINRHTGPSNMLVCSFLLMLHNICALVDTITH